MIKVLDVSDQRYVFNGRTLDLYTLDKDDAESLEMLRKQEETEEIPNIQIKKSSILGKLTINISNAYNLMCSYCYADHGSYGRAEKLMSRKTVDDMINNIKYRGYQEVDTVAFFGGEPLLNKEVLLYSIDCFKNAFNHIHNFEIVTNGIGLDDKMWASFIRNHVKVVISLDGSEDITNALRGSNVHSKVMSSVLKGQALGYENMEVSATYTSLHEQMGYSYNDIVEYFKKLNIKATVGKVLINKDSPLYIADTLTES